MAERKYFDPITKTMQNVERVDLLDDLYRQSQSPITREQLVLARIENLERRGG